MPIIRYPKKILENTMFQKLDLFASSGGGRIGIFLRIARFFELCPSFGILKKILGNTTFQKLDLFASSGGGKTSTVLGPLERANLNHLTTYVSITTAIQGVPGGKVSILGGHSIGHSKQKCVHANVSYSERLLRYTYFTVRLQNY
jgi:hypothetical protein